LNPFTHEADSDSRFSNGKKIPRAKKGPQSGPFFCACYRVQVLSSGSECRQATTRSLLPCNPGAKALVEPFDPTRGIDHLLLPCVEGMALGADFQVDILTDSRPGLDHIAATARGRDLFVFGMDASFHIPDPFCP
jgi:hypothetical protein